MSNRAFVVSPLGRMLLSCDDVYDSAGHQLERSGTYWKLPGVAKTRVLRWDRFSSVPAEIAHALLMFMRYTVETKSSDHCGNVFRELVRLCAKIERYERGGMRALLFGRLADLRRAGAEWCFHYARDWFKWSADQDFPGFEDSELFYELQALRVPGNSKGQAVLSDDPDDGPIDELEEAALRAALLRDNGNLFARALAWAFLALGSNPEVTPRFLDMLGA